MTEQKVLEDYNNTRKLVGHIVRKVQYRYGGDCEEMMADADEYWWRAYTTYDSTRGTDLKTWIYWQVWGHLTTEKRREKVHNVTQYERLQGDEQIVQHQFDMGKLMLRLSSEAQQVVLLTVDLPIPIVKIKCSVNNPTFHDRKREAIKQYLRNCGWNRKQIDGVFQEIAEALLHTG